MKNEIIFLTLLLFATESFGQAQTNQAFSREFYEEKPIPKENRMDFTGNRAWNCSGGGHRYCFHPKSSDKYFEYEFGSAN